MADPSQPTNEGRPEALEALLAACEAVQHQLESGRSSQGDSAGLRDCAGRLRAALDVFRTSRATNRSTDPVQWIVNDRAELGVLVGGEAHFLYKGASLVYGRDSVDEKAPRWYRPVEKREFGECCRPRALGDSGPPAEPYTRGAGWNPLPCLRDPAAQPLEQSAPETPVGRIERVVEQLRITNQTRDGLFYRVNDVALYLDDLDAVVRLAAAHQALATAPAEDDPATRTQRPGP